MYIPPASTAIIPLPNVANKANISDLETVNVPLEVAFVDVDEDDPLVALLDVALDLELVAVPVEDA
jgi:hypothetical protein